MASLTSTRTQQEYYVRRNTPFIRPPSFPLPSLSLSRARGPLAFHLLLLFFLRDREPFSDFFLGATERNEKIRQDPYLRHRDTCHGAKSFDSVSCCMWYFISTLIGRCPLKNIFRGIFQKFYKTRQIYNYLSKIMCLIKVIREKN